MTDEQCSKCKYAGFVRYDDGDMFACAKSSDPRMPFDMEADTYCPCFEKDDDKGDEV